MGLERTPAAGITAVHFVAAEHSPLEGRWAFRRMLSELLGEVEIEADGADPVCLRGMVCRLSRLCVATCFLASRPTALRHGGAAGEADILMVRSMEGPLVVRQGGHAVTAEPGELVFLAAFLPFEWELPLGGRIDCARLPASAMRMADGQLGRVLLRAIPREFPPLQLLVTYGAYLLMRGPHSRQEAEMAQAHFNELLPLVVGYLRGEAPPPARSARLGRIKGEIDAHLSHPDLTAGMIARMHGVTVRYVQRLFQDEGTTFSRFVLDRRLAAARRMIEQDDDRRPISTIAYEVGFGDLSYFNRAFRQRYGQAPSEVRRR
ncbi:transcriptional activator RhrA [Allostella vacuolata]|nr:transcriptional activator RhrA [Stella vacuolata]